MNDVVSKHRRQKTRQRARQAGRGAAAHRPFKDSHLLRWIYAALCWIGCLAAYWLPIRQIPSRVMSPMLMGGSAIAAALALVLLALFLHMVCPSPFRKNSRVLLVSLVLVASLFLARAAESGFYIWTARTAPHFTLYLIPHTFAPILLTLLFGSCVAVIAGIGLSLMTALLWDGNIMLLLTAWIALAICASELQRVRSRSRVLRVALMAGIAQIITVFLQFLLSPSGDTIHAACVLQRAGLSLAGATVGALLVIALLPAIEHVFALTSNITLMHFADLSHPLLQRLALEAPGTYHHSLVVANLAQAAAERIGANGLLARVGSYFHDIGKLNAPTFFIENAGSAANPHDTLAPNISRMIITSHVKEGISLGQLHTLPPPLIDFIVEHHGTSLITWFHHKAKTQSSRKRHPNGNGDNGNDRETVEEGHYRYGGPIPSSRESGIICLADAVEAASRSLEKPTPTHVENLVSDIVAHKILDGQLTRSALTLFEIESVKRAFVAVLGSVLHARIPYPKDEDRHPQSATETPPEPGTSD